MKHSRLKRLATLALSVMVFMVFTMASVMEVNAASGTKTFYVVSSQTYSSSSTSSYDGETSKDSYTTTYTYDKNGLGKGYSQKGTGGTYKSSITRNSKGYATQVKYYKDGKLTETEKCTRNKNGDVKTVKCYDPDNNLIRKESYTYWKKGIVKKMTTKGYGSDHYTSTYSYNKKGNMTSSSYKSGTSSSSSTYKYKFDKKGNAIKTIQTVKSTYNGTTTTNVHTVDRKLTYNKKGLITKSVSKEVITEGDGKVISTDNITSTNTFDKRGNLKKSTFSSETVYSYGSTYSYKSTTTYNYKAVKVPKKYWGMFQ